MSLVEVSGPRPPQHGAGARRSSGSAVDLAHGAVFCDGACGTSTRGLPCRGPVRPPRQRTCAVGCAASSRCRSGPAMRCHRRCSSLAVRVCLGVLTRSAPPRRWTCEEVSPKVLISRRPRAPGGVNSQCPPLAAARPNPLARRCDATLPDDVTRRGLQSRLGQRGFVRHCAGLRRPGCAPPAAEH